MANRLVYRTTITNEFLGKSKQIKATSPAELRMKSAKTLAAWEQEEQRVRARQAIQDMKRQAEEQTNDALALIEEYRSILKNTLGVDDRVDWDALYDSTVFSESMVSAKSPSLEAINLALRVPKPSWLEAIFTGRKTRRLELEAEAQKRFAEQTAAYDAQVAEARAEFERSQTEKNAEIDRSRHAYEQGTVAGVEEYVALVLGRSSYPEGLSLESDVEFVPESGTLVVDVVLPNPDDVPSVVQYRFVQARKAIEPVKMKAKEFDAFYDSVIQQITLRTIHEIFEGDYASHVQTVVFNGWVKGVDRATGKDFTSCLISCQASREEFSEFDLSRVDPKQTIRALKALVAGPLAQLAPVRPIMQLTRDDKRIVESREILAQLDSSQNLATMPWEDFEHLVRELFAQVFSRDDAEVHVTQASRDGGVDAIAFDPDPIRGGKFVIQAKRYNGVVPVSAVRDLYGTMINEGAVKGILVTTSYFGRDAWDFVKDKPITLLDGARLVYMLQEHGHNVRIELGAGRWSRASAT